MGSNLGEVNRKEVKTIKDKRSEQKWSRAKCCKRDTKRCENYKL